MLLDRLQVVVGELCLEHREEAREPLRAEGRRLLVGDLPESLEDVHVQRQHLHRPAQDRVGPVGVP